MEHHTLESWQSRPFAQSWMENDTLADFLDLPRRISAAVVDHDRHETATVLDIASGPGAFLEVYLEQFPNARGIWTDGSEAMREQAALRLARFGDRVEYRLVDMTALGGADLPRNVDVVMTSRATHHLTPEELAAFYTEARSLLAPGGWMVNLDHTLAEEPWAGLFAAAKSRYIGPATPGPGHHTRRLPSLDEQLAGMRSAGLSDRAVVWKCFKTALFMARAR